MSDSQNWYLLSPDGQQSGPHSTKQLHAYATDGTVTPDTQVRTQMTDSWGPAGSVEGLFPDQSQSPAPGVSQISGQPAHAAGSHPELRSVHRGLGLIYWGIAVLALCVIGLFMVPLLMSSGRAPLGGSSTLTVLKFLAIGVLAGGVMGLIGRLMCLAVPAASGGKPFIIGAVSCDTLALIGSVAPFLGLTTIGPMENALNILLIISPFLFLMFLKRVASFIGLPGLATRAGALITLSVILVTFAIFTLLSPMIAPGLFIGIPFLGIGLVIFGIFVFLRYIRLLSDLRLALSPMIRTPTNPGP